MTLTKSSFIICLFMALCAIPLQGQDVKEIRLLDKAYGDTSDSITLFFNVLNEDGKRSQDISIKELEKYFVVYEDNMEYPIPSESRRIYRVDAGQRIPSEYTFSVLVDQSIPEIGKKQIFTAIRKLVDCVSDNCVYLSFFGDNVTPSIAVSSQNIQTFEKSLFQNSENKYFYGALYAKLAEFSTTEAELEKYIKADNYHRNIEIANRANQNPGKNILFVFTEGHTIPSFEEKIGFSEVTNYQQSETHNVPTVYAFYYTEEGSNAEIENVLLGVCNPHIEGRIGEYKPANDMNTVLQNFQEIVDDQMYDYAFTYCATKQKIYFGKTEYTLEWKGDHIGHGAFSIGSAERPWPKHTKSEDGVVLKYFHAILVTILTIIFFFIVLKIIIPLIKSKSFEAKYYKKYIPNENIKHRICCYCKQEIREGDAVVVKCEHIMHIHCWKQNGYKCAEYGQNCKTGIQSHVEWNNLFDKQSLKDCHLTIAGICAGLFSWIIYEIGGQNLFEKLSRFIVNLCYTPTQGFPDCTIECTEKTAAFIAIGMLLGFSLSVVFRYNDEYRSKNWKIGAKIIGLSILTSVIGMGAYIIGGGIMCLLLSALKTAFIPWYCSLPAYILFSICVSLSLTIKSSIPTKTALIGGAISAIIGFFVLYVSRFAGQMNLLLDFILYGGGLGASLVTVRMIAEKYFLTIQNGIRAGLKIPIHKWMDAIGGGITVSIGMAGDCEIQMNWEKSNDVAKKHVELYVDKERQLPMIKPLAQNVLINNRTRLTVGKPETLINGDEFKIGETIFKYTETE